MKIDVTSEDLALINQYTRRELSKDEVYVFSFVLCDNNVDKDFEYFTIESLLELKKLFVGKTGFFGDSQDVSNQTARIFECKFEEVEGRKTTTGNDYFRLKAKAYIVKSESNKDIIEKLNQGVIKEINIGCAVRDFLMGLAERNNSNTYGYEWTRKDGKVVELRATLKSGVDNDT